jgi:hypothetical protein
MLSYAMKTILALAAFLFFASLASAQTVAPIIGTPFVPGNCVQAAANDIITTAANPCGTGGGGGSPGGTTGQIQYNNSGAFGGFTMAGDCTLSEPNITCTKSNGTVFGTGAFATISLYAPLASPVFTGTVTLPITGVSANCLTVNTSGVVSGTGSPCGSGGSGSVTSVAETVNSGSSSGIFTISGSPITTSGTLNIALSGTSGGLSYFSSSTVLSSSAAGTTHGIWLAEGAGNAPITSSAGTIGQCFISNGSSTDPSFQTCPSGSGTVTSIAVTQTGSVFTITGSPVTTSGSINLAFASQTQNFFFAAPNGASGTPSFRAIVVADIPTLNQSTTGNAATATALASSPSICLTGQLTQGILASGNATGCAPSSVPSSNGLYQLVENITGNVPVVPTALQYGLSGRAITGSTSTDTTVYSDNGTEIDHDYSATAAVTQTLHTPTDVGNAAFAYRYSNLTNAYVDTISPCTSGSGCSATFTINGQTNLSVRPKTVCLVKVNPNSPSSDWLGECVPQSTTTAYNSGSISASVGSTNIASSANFPTGQYILSCDVVVTAVGSSPTLAVTVGWTDISGTARTKTCTTGVVSISDNPVTQTITSNGSAAITITQTLAVSTATWQTTAAITRLQ